MAVTPMGGVLKFYYFDKYNKQLKITIVSRDGSAKKYTNKGSYGRDKVHPYNLFSSNRVSMKKIMAACSSGAL